MAQHAKINFLSAETLRGVGGLVLDAHGERFANELDRRDYVIGKMWKNKPPFRLCLNKCADRGLCADSYGAEGSKYGLRG